jgi:hypothetical protein
MRPGGQRYALYKIEQQLQHNQEEQPQQNQQIPQQHPLNETKVAEEAEVEFIPADSSAGENALNNERKEDDQTARGRFERRTSDVSANQGRHAQTLMEVEAADAEPRPGPLTARLRRNEEAPLQRNSTSSSVQFENNKRLDMRSTDVSVYRERRQARDWGQVEQEDKLERKQSTDVYAFEESRHPRSGGAQALQKEKLESRPTDGSVTREVRSCVHDVQTCMLNIAHELDRGHRAHSHLYKVNVVMDMFLN